MMAIFDYDMRKVLCLKGSTKVEDSGGGGGGGVTTRSGQRLSCLQGIISYACYADYEHTVYSWQLRPIFRIFSGFLAPLKFVTNLIKIIFYTRSATDTPKHLSASSRQDVCHVNLV